MESLVRRRAPRATTAHYQLYTNKLLADAEFRIDDAKGGCNTPQMRAKWSHLSSQLNTIGHKKTAESWHSTFKHWKHQLRFKRRTLSRHGRMLTPLEKLALSIWDGNGVEGLKHSQNPTSNNPEDDRQDNGKLGQLLNEQNRLMQSVLHNRTIKDECKGGGRSDEAYASDDNAYSKRKRGPRAISAQFELYVEALQMDYEFRVGTCDIVTLEGKWAELSDRLNRIGPVKTPENWRSTFKSWKNQTRFKSRTSNKKLKHLEKLALSLWDKTDKDHAPPPTDAQERNDKSATYNEQSILGFSEDETQSYASKDNDGNDDDLSQEHIDYDDDSAANSIHSADRHKKTTLKIQPVDDTKHFRDDRDGNPSVSQYEREMLAIAMERVQLKQVKVEILRRREQREILRHDAWMLEHATRIAAARGARSIKVDEDPLLMGEMLVEDDVI